MAHYPMDNKIRYCSNHYIILQYFHGFDPHWKPHKGVSNLSAIQQSANLYSYVLNNPLKHTDPTGLSTEQAIKNALLSAERKRADDLWLSFYKATRDYTRNIMPWYEWENMMLEYWDKGYFELFTCTQNRILQNLFPIRETQISRILNNIPRHNPNPIHGNVQFIGFEMTGEAGIRVNAASGIIWDDHGNIGIMDSFSYGAGILGIDVGMFYGIIDAPSIFDVRGGSFEIGGGTAVPFAHSGKVGLSWGTEVTVSLCEQQYTGNIVNLSAGKGSPVDAHSQLTFTSVSGTNRELVVRAALGPIAGNAVNALIDSVSTISSESKCNCPSLTAGQPAAIRVCNNC